MILVIPSLSTWAKNQKQNTYSKENLLLLNESYTNQEKKESVMDSVTPIEGEIFPNFDFSDGINPMISSLFSSLFWVWILIAIAKFGMFPKMGIERYKAWIPIYSEYLLFLKVWNKTGFFFRLILITFCETVQFWIQIVLEKTGIGMSIFALFFIVLIMLLVVSYMYASWLSSSFGKGDNFAFLLLFFPVIGYFYLGYSKSQYIENAYESNQKKKTKNPFLKKKGG